MKKYLSYLTLSMLVFSCTTPSSETAEDTEGPAPIQVAMQTTYGEIIIELSNKTPLHRDNFISLVKEGAYDSLLFHRVIEGFVVQGGDPDSKYAEPNTGLGRGTRDYMTPAEFDSTLFHKRGAIGAARDNNPDRASGAMQFYFVQASTPLPDSIFRKAERRINGWLQAHYALKAPDNKMWYDSVKSAMKNENWASLQAMRDTIEQLTENFRDFDAYSIPESHREV